MKLRCRNPFSISVYWDVVIRGYHLGFQKIKNKIPEYSKSKCFSHGYFSFNLNERPIKKGTLKNLILRLNKIAYPL